MNERAVTLFERYDVSIDLTRKGRGAIIAKTIGQEEIALVEYSGSAAHLFMEYALLFWMKEHSLLKLDEVLVAKDGQLSCMDYEGKRYIVKRFVEGKECNVFDEASVRKAAKGIATFHKAMRGIHLTDMDFMSKIQDSLKPVLIQGDEVQDIVEQADEIQNIVAHAHGDENQNIVAQDAKAQHIIVQEQKELDMKKQPQQRENSDMDCQEMPDELEENVSDRYKLTSYETIEQTDHLTMEFDKRTNELIRVRNYIRKQSRKNDFELYFLKVYEKYIEQARKADTILTSECEQILRAYQFEQKMYAHGDCTQHNILEIQNGVTLINFEKAGPHLQVKDLYLYMRKVLEKNNWSFSVGQNILDSYESILPLTKEEKQYLYARFVYPEKFWKVANGYLNRRKSVPAKRQLEKLTALEEREKFRQLFLHKWVETY